MAIDFPNSPTTGDTYTAGGRTWQWDGTVWAAYGNYPDPTVLKIDTGTNRVGINNTSPTTALDVTGDLTVSGNISGGSITGAGMTVSSTAPSSPSEGEMWYNEVSGRTFVYYDDGSSQQWVEFGVPPNGSKIALASYADSAARTSAIPSPTEADLSYLQDTNSVEVYDGSAWASIGGLVHISRTTIGTAVSSVTVSGAFSADYDNYQVIVSGGVSSVITGLSMYLDGLTSGYQYAYQFEFWNGTPVSKGASTSDTKWSTCGEGTPTSLKVNMTLMSPFLSKEKTMTFAHAGTNVVTRGGGLNADTTSRTGFVVFPNSGTLTGGTIDVYGYAKA